MQVDRLEVHETSAAQYIPWCTAAELQLHPGFKVEVEYSTRVIVNSDFL